MDESKVIVDFTDEGTGSGAEAAAFLKTLEGGTAARDQAVRETPEPREPAPKKSVETAEPEVLESEGKPTPEDAAPAEEATPETEPATSETSEPGPDDAGNPKLYAGKYASADELEKAYKASSSEFTRAQQRHEAQQRETAYQLEQARQQLAAVSVQHPPTWEELTPGQRDHYERTAAHRNCDPQALFEADVLYHQHQAIEAAQATAKHRETARVEFVARIDQLEPDVAEATWDALERSGVDWRSLFDHVSPELSSKLGNQLLEVTAERVKLTQEVERLKAGRQQIALEARHEGINQARQSIGHKKKAGTEASRAQTVPQKNAGEPKSTSNLIDELLAYDRDKSRFDVVHD